MKTFSEQVMSFYRDLDHPPEVPEAVKVLYPHRSTQVWEIMTRFYNKYYNDSNQRVFLIGINPGRLGAGITGIPFTDPIRLKEACGIDNNFAPKPELSSRFIYGVIDAFGGVNEFYKSFYITAVSPLGFIRHGKNLNYYDIKELQDLWEPFMVECLRKQIEMGACPRAICLGQGKNYKYLQYLNEKHQLFEAISPLPHPRWIMQYRLKRLEEFVEVYCSELTQAVT